MTYKKYYSILLSLYKGPISCLLKDNSLLLAGPLAAIDLTIPPTVTVCLQDEDHLLILKNALSLRFIHEVFDALQGVSQGFAKDLVLVGVGYRAFLLSGSAVKSFNTTDFLCLRIGYSNIRQLFLPAGVLVSCKKANLISIFGLDKQKVHHLAAQIRQIVKLDPYKGKGIIYFNEIIHLKEGKKQ